MTLDEFLTELEKTKTVFHWKVLPSIRGYDTREGRIRGFPFCPLTAVSSLKNYDFDLEHAHLAGKYLGLADQVIMDIIVSADNNDGWNENQESLNRWENLRGKILETLGVTNDA